MKTASAEGCLQLQRPARDQHCHPANTDGLEYAISHIHRQNDFARTSHGKSLRDDNLMIAVGRLLELEANAGKGRSGRAGCRILQYSRNRGEHPRMHMILLAHDLAGTKIAGASLRMGKNGIPRVEIRPRPVEGLLRHYRDKYESDTGGIMNRYMVIEPDIGFIELQCLCQMRNLRHTVQLFRQPRQLEYRARRLPFRAPYAALDQPDFLFKDNGQFMRSQHVSSIFSSDKHGTAYSRVPRERQFDFRREDA